MVATANRDPKERPWTTLEQAALRRIATLAAEGVLPEELFAIVAEEIGRVVDAPSVVVGRYEPDGTSRVCAALPAEGPPFTTGDGSSLKDGNVLSVIREHAEPARVDTDVDTARSGDICSRVGVPVMVAGRVWGAVVASSGKRLADDTETCLTEITRLLAAAIAVAHAREGLTQLADEQAALQRVATLVAQAAAPAKIFAAVSAEVDRVLHLNSAAFGVAGVIRFEPGRELVVVGVSKDVEAFPLGSRFRPDDRFAPAHVLRTGRSTRLSEHDLGSAGVEFADFPRDHGYLSQVASPIFVGD
jgi:hypothetical protein